MEQIVFDERVAAQLEVFYGTREVLRRRALVAEALVAQPGDRVLDIGCGPGFYLADGLERIGPEGSAMGVDMSTSMLEASRRRLAGAANVKLLEGNATALPVGDEAFDRALSVQVFEYVTDIPAALAELWRVLRPGGRAVVWATDWSTLSWHSGHGERMARMTAAWDRHLADPVLPRTLAAAMRTAGFADVERAGHVFASTSMDPETFGGNAPAIVRGYLKGLADVDQAEADAWLAELRELDARGEYSYALTQFCFAATRPT